MTAGLFPIIHLGRPWYLLLADPVPEPALALAELPVAAGLGRVRDHHVPHGLARRSSTSASSPTSPPRATRRPSRARKKLYSVLSLGWRGTDREWRHFTRAYLFLAALATPLVLSVHSVVSWDFAMAHRARLAHDDLPALLRRRRHLLRHRDGDHAAHPDAQDLRPRARTSRSTTSTRMAKLLPAHVGCIVVYAYLTEYFIAWYSGEHVRARRPSGTACSATTGGRPGSCSRCNGIVPQLLWFKQRAARSRRCSSSRSSSTSACGSSAS